MEENEEYNWNEKDRITNDYEEQISKLTQLIENKIEECDQFR